MLSPETLSEVQRAIGDAGLDGWLLYDFRGLNPIAAGLLRLDGMTTRRAFAFIPRDGKPTALTHAIEQGPWRHWPKEWKREIYASWNSLESLLLQLVNGKRVAMEYSAGDAVPYLDRVPAGVIEMVRQTGASVTSSGELVSRFYARWNADHIASHARAAEIIAQIARDAMRMAGERARSNAPLAEHELMRWIRDRFAAARLNTDHGPNVSAGANAANPHYEPSADEPRIIETATSCSIDLWAREEPDGVYADQTWMASIGHRPMKRCSIWDAVRDARDAAIALVQRRAAAGEPVRGADVDDAARAVIRIVGSASTSRTAPATRSTRATCTAPVRTSTTSRRARNACSFPASRSRSSRGSTFPGASACAAR